MSDEEIIQKIIENHDKNLSQMEELSKERRRNYTMSERIGDFFIPGDEYHKYQTEELEFLNFLKNYTKTLERAQRELNFVRVQSDKWGYDYGTMREDYVNSYYPAAHNAKLNQAVLHNLYISLLEYAAANSATDTAVVKLIEGVSRALVGKNFLSEKELEEINLLFPDFQNYVNYTMENSKDKKINTLYANLADRIHFDFNSKAQNTLDPIVSDYKKKKNLEYEKSNDTSEQEFISKILPDLLEIIYKISVKLVELMKRNLLREKREKFNYNYEKFQSESDIFTPEEQDKIYGRIEMFRPYSNLQWKQGPPEGGIQLEYDTNLNYKLNYNDENQSSLTSVSPEQIMVASTDDEIVDTSETKYPETFEDDVKDIIANVFDDFAQLKGFRKRNIT